MLLLTRACEDLEKERQEREEEKVRYLGEKLPPLQMSGKSLQELQVSSLKPQKTSFCKAENIILLMLSISDLLGTVQAASYKN